MGFYTATKEDVKVLDSLANRMKNLFGPKLDYTGSLVVPGIEPEQMAGMVHATIALPFKEFRNKTKDLIRTYGYYLHMSAYKVDSMPRVSYMINFYQRIDRKVYRHQYWAEGLEANKIFVYGDTEQEAWDKFVAALQTNKALELVASQE